MDWRGVLGLAILLGLAGCQNPPPPAVPTTTPEAHHLNLTPVGFDDLPGWGQDHWAQAVPAVQKSCARILQMPPDAAIGTDGVGGSARDWWGPCGALQKVAHGDDQAARQVFESWFSPWMMTDNAKPEGLFTGYFEAEVAGSRHRHDRYQVPLYPRPKDLVTVDLARLRPDLAKELGHEQLAGRVVSGRLEPYPTRSEIETKGLGDDVQPLFWLDDPVDAHILHIQGSGRVRLEDGTLVRVAVATTNGQHFVGLGRILTDHGVALGAGNMPEIREWLRAHGTDAKSLMAENPRYVFYRLVEGDGPVGAQGVALTPMRSVAIDPRFVPLGVPLWLDTKAPSGATVRQIVVAQDTGAAIKGPVRADIFWGTGEEAFQQAGRMKAPGRAWMLLPRDRTPHMAFNGR